jgi:hypothetical protein
MRRQSITVSVQYCFHEKVIYLFYIGLGVCPKYFEMFCYDKKYFSIYPFYVILRIWTNTIIVSV